jgi:tetratricopeptide (TPR) repeat protein
MMRRNSILVVAGVSFLLNHHHHDVSAFTAFSVHHVARKHHARQSMTAVAAPPLHMVLANDNDNDNDHFDENADFFDVEAARRELEALVDGGGSGVAGDLPAPSQAQSQAPAQQSKQQLPEIKNKNRPTASSSSWLSGSSTLPATPLLDVTMPPPPPLTTIQRERSLAEIEQIFQLVNGDESLTDIWNLWFSERGPKAEALLQKADDLMSEGPAGSGFRQSEEILRGLIEEYGVFFVEPVNRLATLYYLEGRLEEALPLNKIVLSVKPWHFGALSGIVMVYAGLGDAERARQWAAFRLPSSAQTRRRHQWVERAVLDIQGALNQAEKRNVDGFGKPDMHITNNNAFEGDDAASDDDAWQ